MTNKTEKLRGRIEVWLPHNMPNKEKVVTAILCECKEIGLKFVIKVRTKQKLNDTGGFYFDEGLIDIEDLDV